MKKYTDYKSNYDKYPVVKVSETAEGICFCGWQEITDRLNNDLAAIDRAVKIVVVECYQGVLDEEVRTALQKQLAHTLWIDSASAMKPADEINAFLKDDITDDEIFGYMTRHNIDCYFDEAKVAETRRAIEGVTAGTIVVYGTGAAYLSPRHDLLVYALSLIHI